MPSTDEFISQLYRAVGQVPLADFRQRALELLRPLIHFDGAVWGTGHTNTREFYTHTYLEVSEDLFEALQDSQAINPVYQYHLKHVIEPELNSDKAERNRECLGKPVDMADLVPDEEFFQSKLYKQYLGPHNIERLLSAMHVNERSGIFTLLTLYRFDRAHVFTEKEKRMQQHLLFHLISAASHASFVELQKRHHDTHTANALCDKHGNYHEVESGFLDLMESFFGKDAQTRLPFPPTEHGALINSLHIESESIGELYYVGIRPEQALDKLTQREKEVVSGICKGLTFKTIARNLALSPSTISNHLYRIYRKLGINSRSELVALLENKQN